MYVHVHVHVGRSNIYLVYRPAKWAASTIDAVDLVWLSMTKKSRCAVCLARSSSSISSGRQSHTCWSTKRVTSLKRVHIHQNNHATSCSPDCRTWCRGLWGMELPLSSAKWLGCTSRREKLQAEYIIIREADSKVCECFPALWINYRTT